MHQSVHRIYTASQLKVILTVSFTCKWVYMGSNFQKVSINHKISCGSKLAGKDFSFWKFSITYKCVYMAIFAS